MDMNMGFTDDTLAYNVVLLNNDFERKALLAPFNKKRRGFIINTYLNGFSQYGNDFIYLRAASDTLFLLKKEELVPLAKFDFGRNWLWSDKSLGDGGENIMQAMQSRKAIWNLGARMQDNWLYLNYMYSFRDIRAMLIDRSTDQYRIFNLNMLSGENLGLNALRWEDGRLLFSIPSPNITELLSGLDEGQVKFRMGTNLEEIESSENPVIMWVKFKNIMK